MENSGDDSINIQRPGRRSIQQLEAVLAGSPAVRDEYVSRSFKRKSATLSIQRSLQLLDESVGSPSARGVRTPSSARTPVASRTPGGSLKFTTPNYKPRRWSADSDTDRSGRLGPTPKKTPQAARSDHMLGGYEESFQSPFNRSRMGPLLEDDTMEEVTTTNVGLLLEEDPGVSASKGLYTDFLECLRSNPSESECFNLVEQYEGVCREQQGLLRKLVGKAFRQEDKFQKTYQVLKMLSDEEATWKLIKNLFKDRLMTSMKDDMEMEHDDVQEDVVVQGVHQSDQKTVTALFERDQQVREAQLVVDWLESCAQEDCEKFAENIKFFSDRAVGYENSLHRLQNKQPGVLLGVERPSVTTLDPDAALRENKILDDLDKEDEDRLLQYVFICIRAGQLEKAQKMCMDCGQAWRAATLEGWKLFHDPNYVSTGSDYQKVPVEGNPYRDIWKAVCWNMTQDPRINAFEKAIYGVLSGNLRVVLPVCKSWLDYLWGYFRVMVDSKVEDEIRQKTTLGRPLEPLPGEYWEKHLDPKIIFKEIEAEEMVRSESHHQFHVLQKHIILNDIPGLIDVMYEWVRESRNHIPLHLLRFMSHLLLFLRVSHDNTKEELSNVILEAYVEELIREKHHTLVAFYVSKLPPSAQVHWYARFLEGITNKEERQRYLDLAEDAGLDLPQITKRVVENIRSHSHVDFSSLPNQQMEAVDTQVSEEDRRKIEAIEWLVFDISQRAEAMRQGNAVMRTFIAVKKLVAAREVFCKLPSDSVDVIHKTWHMQMGTTELLAQDKNAIREYLCMKAYLDAMDSFSDWFNHYHHGKPVKPSPPQTASFTDKVAYEHRLKLFEQEQDRWHHNLIMQTQTTKDHIYNVLLFADGGWMVDQFTSESDEDGDESEGYRQEQMTGLRRLVLPGLAFLLHNVLHTSQQFTESLQLADIVTSDQHKLYEVFRKDELQRLMCLLRESSLPLLDQGRDPLGYELV